MRTYRLSFPRLHLTLSRSLHIIFSEEIQEQEGVGTTPRCLMRITSGRYRFVSNLSSCCSKHNLRSAQSAGSRTHVHDQPSARLFGSGPTLALPLPLPCPGGSRGSSAASGEHRRPTPFSWGPHRSQRWLWRKQCFLLREDQVIASCLTC